MLASIEDAELTEYALVIDELSIHDTLIVASHKTRETDAIITSDGVIADAGYETVWN
jgi:predicted HNH restriction endonuclease